jgi:hypothetical protein
MRGLAEQIAVLDGLTIDPSDGANYQGGSSYPDRTALPLLPSNAGLAAASDLLRAANSIARRGVLDPSEGANYGGGSNYPDNAALPLLPSTVGLAGVSIDPSDGTNYQGGSSYPDRVALPLLPSNAGLAGLARLADDFLEAVGKKAAYKASGNVFADAKRKLALTIKSLNTVIANPNTAPATRLRAAKLRRALQSAWMSVMAKKAAAAPVTSPDPWR